MIERFTDEEWQVLLTVPAHLLIHTTVTDDEIGTKEAEEVAERLANAAVEHREPLYHELARDLVDDMESLMETVILVDPPRSKQILQDKLSPEEYERFLLSVWIDGRGAAMASGSLSPEAGSLLVGWAEFYEVDLAKVIKGWEKTS